MEYEKKACSRCGEFKSLGEFYKQGNRYESLCKECKKRSREKNEVQPSSKNCVAPTKRYDDDRETMPVFDESIFYPEEHCRALGLDDNDIASIVAFFRWHMDQRAKRMKKEEET